MPIRTEQSCRYVSRRIGFVTNDMLRTTELIASERFSGSRSLRSSKSVLNSMKSV